MTPEQIRAALVEEIVNIAPDIDLTAVRDDDHMQEDLELDSMDFLNLVSAIQKRFGVSVPERDYPDLATPGTAVAYIVKAIGDGKQAR